MTDLLHIFEAEWLRDESPRHEFRVDRSRRTVAGLIVPWNVASSTTRAGRWRFTQGSIYWTEVSRVKLTRSHNPDALLGRAVELEDRRDGLYGRFLVSRTAEGDQVLREAEDRVLDGFSMEVGVEASTPGRDGVGTATRAKLGMVTLTAMPAFDDARVTHVAASRTGEPSSPDAGSILEPTGLDMTDWNPRRPVGDEHLPTETHRCAECDPGYVAPVVERSETRRVEVGGVILTIAGGPDIAGDAFAAVLNNTMGGCAIEPPRGYSAAEREAFWAEVAKLRQVPADLALRRSHARALATAGAMTAEVGS